MCRFGIEVRSLVKRRIRLCDRCARSIVETLQELALVYAAFPVRRGRKMQLRRADTMARRPLAGNRRVYARLIHA